jgi:hypothetical protein
LVFFYTSEKNTHGFRQSEARASFFDTLAMRFEDRGIESVDFLAYDVYLHGMPIDHLDLEWDIPSIYLFPALRKT